MSKKKSGDRRKVWEVQTQLYDTYGDPYIDLDKFYARLDELHTDDPVRPTIKNYARIIHNRCKYTQDDEDAARKAIANGSKRKQVMAGDMKPEHLHCPLQLTDAKTLSALALLLGIPENMIVYVNENADGEAMTFDDKCAYLCHERQIDKTPYEYDEITCTFNYADMMRRYSNRMKRKNRSKVSKAFVDEHVNAIASGDMSKAEFIRQYGYAVYESAKSKYDHAEEYYLRTRYMGEGLRLTHYITGTSTVGKTPLAKFYACSMFPDIQNPREVFYCTGDNGCSLQNYNGQPVIIWDDYRAVDFLTMFGRKVLFNSLFAVHPEPTDFNIKYGSIVLRNVVNIITSIDPLDVFVRELAGGYVDKNGVTHKSEEKQVKQAYKRIWSISEVTADEIVFKVNEGYLDGDNYYYKQFIALARMRNNTRELARKYNPKLYGEIGKLQFSKIKDEYDNQMERERQKIDDVSMIDSNDFVPVITDPETLVEMEQQDEVELFLKYKQWLIDDFFKEHPTLRNTSNHPDFDWWKEHVFLHAE